MILYFDNYITDTPMYKGGHLGVYELRNSCKNYEMPSKLLITIYALTSYAEIKWSKVIIKYELENVSQKKKFESFVKKLFPKAVFIYGRSDSQKKFQESIKLLRKFKDEWVFYAGNNDHPFMAPNLKTLNACLKKAKEARKKNKFVSISVSHFSEFLNKIRKGTPYHEIDFHDSKILEEDENCVVCFFPRGLNHSMQILHIDLFSHWFFSGDSKNTLVRRSEDMTPFIKTKNQVVVIPKNELCAHFDGEVHTDKSPYSLEHDIVPPLFIPLGFFEKQIKIAYGYDDYREGWVNINPLKAKYSFRDKENGTDLKISLEDIPLFWKKRISKMDINSNLYKEKIKKAIIERKHLLKNPLPKKPKIYWKFFRIKSKIIRGLYFIPFIRIPGIYLMTRFKFFRNLYISIIKIRF